MNKVRFNRGFLASTAGSICGFIEVNYLNNPP